MAKTSDVVLIGGIALIGYFLFKSGILQGVGGVTQGAGDIASGVGGAVGNAGDFVGQIFKDLQGLVNPNTYNFNIGNTQPQQVITSQQLAQNYQQNFGAGQPLSVQNLFTGYKQLNPNGNPNFIIPIQTSNISSNPQQTANFVNAFSSAFHHSGNTNNNPFNDASILATLKAQTQARNILALH